MPLLPPFLEGTRRLPSPIPAGMQGLLPATTVAEAALLAANRSIWTCYPPQYRRLAQAGGAGALLRHLRTGRGQIARGTGQDVSPLMLPS